MSRTPQPWQHLRRAWERCGFVRAFRMAWTLLAFALTPTATADTAAFALAPRDASVALDARNLAQLLEDVDPATIRAAIENFAGPQAVATFDLLAARDASGRDIAREVFSGRIAFFVPESAGSVPWMLGFEAQDDRCELILRMIGAKMLAPGRFDSYTESLVVRRAGGWLLVTPRCEAADASLEAATGRIQREDPVQSLLGDPAMQRLIPSDAPVRLFLRHAPPLGGSTAVAVSRADRAIRAEIRGSYDRMPISPGLRGRALDRSLVRAFEADAVMVFSNPANGKPTVGDLAWTTMIPEIVPSPAMRTNLAGERIVAVGRSRSRAMPAVALAWRVDDADQAATDQELYMRNLCCGIARAADSAGGAPAPAPDAGAPVERVVECVALGSFLDRYFGPDLRLSDAVLAWRTVKTPCGGWQLYSTDSEWMEKVGERLASDSCHEGPGEAAASIGFCDGPRAAALLRVWKPLTKSGGEARLSPGIAAVADALEQLGRMRFRYQTPNAREIDAVIDFEMPERASARPARVRAAVRRPETVSTP